MRRSRALLLMLALATLAVACATSFSPAAIRAEIARQTGADPQRVFELNLGQATMALARRVMGPADNGSLPLAGLTRLELAVYDVPATGRSLDFTAMAVRGWEPTVRSRTSTRSTLVLVRGSGNAIGDLVLVTADEKRALYARLTGRLSRELPAALGEAAAVRGTDGLKQQLLSLTGGG